MLDLKPATFEDFEREAGQGNVVPVVRTVLADLQTPVGAFLASCRGQRHTRFCSNQSRAANASRVIRFSALIRK